MGSIGAGGVLLNVATPGNSLVDYRGGNLCSVAAPGCALSDIFLTPTLGSNALDGRLSLRASAVPEPEPLSMLLIGVAALAAARRRRRR